MFLNRFKYLCLKNVSRIKLNIFYSNSTGNKIIFQNIHQFNNNLVNLIKHLYGKL